MDLDQTAAATSGAESQDLQQRVKRKRSRFGEPKPIYQRCPTAKRRC
jgi:hypothetical protein